jgi:hypothetical protein
MLTVSAAWIVHGVKSGLTQDLVLECILLGGLLLLAAVLPVDRVSPERWQVLYGQFAARKYLPILTVIVAAGVLRLALLPWFPIPLPRIHDEFSLLLGAKTFAMGRVTNPPHPLWVSFETFHVLQQPTYTSIYPPAQAAMLALGILTGHAWFAVLGCAMLVSGAFVWMLRPWFSGGWALCGGILLLSRTLMSYWSDSYWGGALAALSAAIVVGAAGRIWFQPTARPRDALLLGAGAAVLLNRRPLEGSLVCAGIGLMLTYWLLKKAEKPVLRQALKVTIPVLAILLPCAIFIGYYNLRVTGNPFMLPYLKGIQTYSIARHDILLPAAAEPAYRNQEFRSFYRDEYAYYRSRQQHFLRSLMGPAFESWHFYLGPSLSLSLLLALPWSWQSPRIRPILLILAGCLAVNATETWILPHYLAPEAPLMFIVVIESLAILASKGSTWGRPIVAASVVSCALAVPGTIFCSVVSNTYSALTFGRYGPYHDTPSWGRFRIAAKLAAAPGKHLVFVKYLPSHSSHFEWVYNEPDIDSSKVVWARDLGPEQNGQCLNYFSDRRIWEVEVSARTESLREIRPPIAASQPSRE